MTLFMSIHGNPDYLNFIPEINIPTIVVGCLFVVALIRLWLDIRMCFIYYWTFRSRPRIHKHLFESFLWMDGSNFLFSFFDNLAFRIPSTGFLTSWCAEIEPNKLLTFIYAAQLVSSYLSLFSTLLFTMVRVGILIWPMDHEKKMRTPIRIFKVFAVVLPTVHVGILMSPAVGYCRQWPSPYSFGAVFLSFSDMRYGWRNDPIYFGITFVVPLMILVVNIILHILLKKYRNSAQRNSRAYTSVEEASLMYTTIAMTAPFIVHGLMAVIPFIVLATSGYVVMLRSPVTEFGQLSVPLVFCWNNPMFSFKKSKKVNPVKTSPIAPSMLNS